MTDKEQIAHDKAIAYTQATFLRDLNKQNEQPHHKITHSVEEVDLFNYTYSQAFKLFFNEY
ncbi:hypothetical protein KAR50_00035 [Periweissella fabaria]|uniref:Uncharacterized protein n=1 Tax=Periweissella fabaria TaxID=546157 RepID=A0ABM8Z7W1_9LACO|nr:hypothetical protein [Periweissella fabaria]MCM0596250.1 hypothetical protein [Periweissella fabaria]CAH0417498.1 hypothetical protein WFA24289_01840 [Periweissella fabaria]